MPDIGEVKKQLKATLLELGTKVKEIEGDLRAPRSADWAERATEIEDDEVLDALEDSAIKEIRDIHAALRRIDDGTYSECSMCGKAIGEKRLTALPYATTCIECAEAA